MGLQSMAAGWPAMATHISPESSDMTKALAWEILKASALGFVGGRVEAISSDTGPTDPSPCCIILNLKTIHPYPRWGFLRALCEHIAEPSLKETALFFRGEMPGRGSLIRLGPVIRGIQGQNRGLGGSQGCINVLYCVGHSKENDQVKVNGVKKAATRVERRRVERRRVERLDGGAPD